MQRVLARMTERGVAQIMRQRHGLCQLTIKPQCPRNRARHLLHLDRMGQTRAIIIALMFHEHLRLVLEPPKGAGMDDTIAVPLIAGAKSAFLFRYPPSHGSDRIRGIWSAHCVWSLWPVLSLSILDIYSDENRRIGASP